MTPKVDPDFRRQLEGWSLATAEIYYRMPDARSLIQTYLWQDYDLAPDFPRLREFLDFWTRELDIQRQGVARLWFENCSIHLTQKFTLNS